MKSDIFGELIERYRSFKMDLKGGVGEFAAALALKYKVSGDMRIIRNVYVPLSDGKTAEIDLVIVHTTGIYAVECKNYSGWIFGSEDNKMWTQSFSNSKRFPFYNPVLQNRYHINALSRYLNVPADNFVSYIVFGEQCELKKVPANTDSLSVMQLHDLPQKANNDLLNRPHLFSDSVVELFGNKLEALRDTTGQKKREHIAQVKKAHPESSSKGKGSQIDRGGKNVGSAVDSFISSFFKF